MVPRVAAPPDRQRARGAAGEGGIRCRSYASFLALDPAGAPVLKGYAAYDDIWALDAGEWRLAYRETVMYGHAPSRP